ncbi:ACT domain-containing protein, partial [Serratia marcescens]|uniref:ACT domain-containing protein n=1 Tax=Serratia marcescens TaxID=615 RepID=UPI002814267E
MTTSHLVLKFRAPDRPGIMARIAPLVAAQGCDIREAAVYGDPDTGSFFSRIGLISPLDRDA